MACKQTMGSCKLQKVKNKEVQKPTDNEAKRSESSENDTWRVTTTNGRKEDEQRRANRRVQDETMNCGLVECGQTNGKQNETQKLISIFNLTS